MMPLRVYRCLYAAEEKFEEGFLRASPGQGCLAGGYGNAMAGAGDPGAGYERGLDLGFRRRISARSGSWCMILSRPFTASTRKLSCSTNLRSICWAHTICWSRGPGGVWLKAVMEQIDSLREAIRERVAPLPSSITIIPRSMTGYLAIIPTKRILSFLFQVRKLNYELMRYARHREAFISSIWLLCSSDWAGRSSSGLRSMSIRIWRSVSRRCPRWLVYGQT